MLTFLSFMLIAFATLAYAASIYALAAWRATSRVDLAVMAVALFVVGVGFSRSANEVRP